MNSKLSAAASGEARCLAAGRCSAAMNSTRLFAICRLSYDRADMFGELFAVPAETAPSIDFA